MIIDAELVGTQSARRTKSVIWRPGRLAHGCRSTIGWSRTSSRRTKLTNEYTAASYLTHPAGVPVWVKSRRARRTSAKRSSSQIPPAAASSFRSFVDACSLCPSDHPRLGGGLLLDATARSQVHLLSSPDGQLTSAVG
jgi:hypothetical protein